MVTVDPFSASPRRKKPKYTTSYVDCPEFSSYLEKTCYESMPRRRLVVMYLAVWLSEVIFPIVGKEVRTDCIYPACKIAFRVRYALALAMALVSYLCTRLKMIGFLMSFAKPYNQYYGEHLLYAWFVYHCQGLHHLGKQEICLFTGLSQMGVTWAFLLLPLGESWPITGTMIFAKDR